MELTVREVAALLGRSVRTVRAQMARGELPAKKRGGKWCIERRHLPLTESQRSALQGKADRVRQAVEEALPPRMARSSGQRVRSIADLDAFRRGAEMLGELRDAAATAVPEAVRDQATQDMKEALLALAEGVQLFDRQAKLAALNRARAGLARGVAGLLLEAGIPPPEPIFSWVAAIEAEVIAPVAGYARWADRLGEKRR